MKKQAATIQEQSKNFPEGDKGSEGGLQRQFFTRIERLIILIVFFAAAFYIRIYHIEDPPLVFHPNRQYHSAMIARAIYYNHSQAVAQWQKEIATLNRTQEVVGELPILEYVAAIAYGIAGGEYLWIPRVINVIFWLTGGLILYFFVGRILSFDGAILSLGFFLFLPYVVEASRSFQPNPFMIMLLIISITFIYRYFEQPTQRNLAAASCLSAVTFFIYPTSVFPLLIPFIILSIYEKGFVGALKDWRVWTFCIITILPAVVYYSYITLVAGSIQGYAQVAFLPQILVKAFFWKGWLLQVEKVIGLIALIGGLLGLLLFPKGRAKVLLCGLWLSYVIYALIFSYHIHTHDYYQLPFVPTVAISIGAMAVGVLYRFGEESRKLYTRIGVTAVILFAVFLVVYKEKEQLYNPGFPEYVRMLEEIGETIGHSRKTISLTYSYGKPLRYHGQISGFNWPDSGDFRAYKMSGIAIPSAEERFKTLSKDGADFFIITDFREFNNQQDLKNFLTQNFPVFTENQNYIIFDLRKRLKK